MQKIVLEFLPFWYEGFSSNVMIKIQITLRFGGEKDLFLVHNVATTLLECKCTFRNSFAKMGTFTVLAE